jgi:threonine dehydrogenase-like Zn-dependent dehydrogenase
LILGHEASGIISGGDRDGERVTINPLVTCMNCQSCKAGRENICPNRQIISMAPREGTFAEMVAVPETNLVKVPSNISLDKAALTEPLAVSWHAARLAIEALHPSMDRSVLIVGGGAIGLASALAFKAMGIENIIIVEPNSIRRKYLNDKCNVISVEKVDQFFSIVVDAVGFKKTREIASAKVSPGGVITHIGLGEDTGGIDVRRITLQEVSFIGTYTYTAGDFMDTAQAIFDGRLGPLDWIERRPLSEGNTAFREIREGKIASPKVLLSPNC